MKRVLLLGAGMVARPLVAHLLERDDISLTVADIDGARAAAVAGGSPRAKGIALDVRDLTAVADLLEECDLLVSFLPPEFEPDVTQEALAAGKSMVSASPRGEAGMEGLDGPVREAGITFLPEVGLDPGLDHMAIARMVARVKSRGGTVTACRSYCAGLPAPEIRDANPLHYKFSWNPNGVIYSMLYDGRYLEEGRVVEVPNEELFVRHWPVSVPGFDELEAHYNGDAIPYVEIYGLEGVEDMVRGTLRYPGWSQTFEGLRRLGYKSTAVLERTPPTYAALTRRLAGIPDDADLVAGLAEALEVTPWSPLIGRLVWLGLAAEEPVVWREGQPRTPLEAFANRMYARLMYEAGERDASVLHNEIEARYPSGERERSTATLVVYGDPEGDSSMATTVGIPAAIAATLILDGRVTERGLVLPVEPHIYEPILEGLAARGIAFRERTAAIS